MDKVGRPVRSPLGIATYFRTQAFAAEHQLGGRPLRHQPPRGRIEAVLNSARALGLIDENRANPARWKGHLDQLLPNPKKVGQLRGHRAAMPYADIPAFMVRLKAAPDAAARELIFAILCAARWGEVFGATWNEIDLDAGVWAVPPDRMKMGRPHRVPLSAPAVDILRGQLAARGKNPHVFPGARPRQPLSVMALAMAMRGLGAGEFTPHGFRSAFRDWAGDRTNFQREVAEAVLTHAVGDKTEQAYRRELMDAWASPRGGRRQAVHLHPLSRRAPAGPLEVDPHLERDRAPARGVQAPRQDPDHPALLLWALLAPGLITMRKVDGWQTLAGKPADPIIA
jgi:integrase